MRRRAKVDSNQSEIVAALRKVGATVQHLHVIGAGCPDILVGYRKVSLPMEIKAGKAPLNAIERDWHAWWRGSVVVVRSPEDAVGAILARSRA